MMNYRKCENLIDIAVKTIIDKGKWEGFVYGEPEKLFFYKTMEKYYFDRGDDELGDDDYEY